MGFFAGQKIVCVNDSNLPDCLSPIARGAIYTVREARLNPRKDCIGLRLCEIRNNDIDTVMEGRGEPFYSGTRFRPLTERKNDGEAFVEQLKRDCIPSPTKVKEREGVE